RYSVTPGRAAGPIRLVPSDVMRHRTATGVFGMMCASGPPSVYCRVVWPPANGIVTSLTSGAGSSAIVTNTSIRLIEPCSVTGCDATTPLSNDPVIDGRPNSTVAACTGVAARPTDPSTRQTLAAD